MKSNKLDARLVKELKSDRLDTESVDFQIGFMLGQFAHYGGEKEGEASESLCKELKE